MEPIEQQLSQWKTQRARISMAFLPLNLLLLTKTKGLAFYKAILYISIFIVGCFSIFWTLKNDNEADCMLSFFITAYATFGILHHLVEVLNNLPVIEITEKNYKFFLFFLSNTNIRFINKYWLNYSFNKRTFNLMLLRYLYSNTEDCMKKLTPLKLDEVSHSHSFKQWGEDCLKKREHTELKNITNCKVGLKKNIL